MIAKLKKEIADLRRQLRRLQVSRTPGTLTSQGPSGTLQRPTETGSGKKTQSDSSTIPYWG